MLEATACRLRAGRLTYPCAPSGTNAQPIKESAQ